MFPRRFFPLRFFPSRAPTVPGTSQKERIQNALLAIAAAGSFFLVTYDPVTAGLVRGAATTPKSIRSNEVSATYEEDSHYRRAFRQDRKVWRWKLYLAFDREVTCEAFEEDLLLTPRWIPRTGELRQVRLLLVDTTYTHPQQHQPAPGTTAVYTFEASQSPA